MLAPELLPGCWLRRQQSEATAGPCTQARVPSWGKLGRRAWKIVMLRSITIFCANLNAAMSGRPQGPYTVKKRSPVTDIE